MKILGVKVESLQKPKHPYLCLREHNVRVLIMSLSILGFVFLKHIYISQKSTPFQLLPCLI